MIALKRVLVATNFEPASASALRHGTVLPGSFGRGISSTNSFCRTPRSRSSVTIRRVGRNEPR
jgi:hypothetical protein